VVHVPTREERATKNLVNVASCRLYWHPQGDFLCVHVERLTKNKKSTFSTFEIFRIREKGIPVDHYEMTDKMVSLAWEPQSRRFAVLHGEEQGRVNVSFFLVEEPPVRTAAATGAASKTVLQKTLDKKQINEMYWSPKGQYIVLANVRPQQGANVALEFWDTHEHVCLNMQEHFMVTNVEWDPTGRYVASIVNSTFYAMESGVVIYTFYGKPIFRRPCDRLMMFGWRRRPPTLLSAEQVKSIKKNIKSYASKFEMQDTLEASRASKEVAAAREKLMQEFADMLLETRRQLEAERELRLQLRGGVSLENQAKVVEEEIVEVLLSEKVETVNIEDLPKFEDD
jgi:translation initiation factor 3 subunit B